MTSHEKLIVFLFTGFASVLCIIACGGGLGGDTGFSGGECGPQDGEDCFCVLDDDGVTIVTDECIDGITDDGENCFCEIGEAPLPPEPEPEPDPEPEGPVFRFVMVQDEVANPAGDFPGTDLDALGLIKSDGREVFAESVEAETDIDCEGNLACDIASALGAPDAINPETGECFGGSDAPDTTQFIALNGGRIVVGFGTETIDNGDSIHVYELGAAECGRFDDDSFSVSVSATDDFTGDVVDLGIAGDGNNIVDVTGLP